jgi:hypothetical protein
LGEICPPKKRTPKPCPVNGTVAPILLIILLCPSTLRNFLFVEWDMIYKTTIRSFLYIITCIAAMTWLCSVTATTWINLFSFVSLQCNKRRRRRRKEQGYISCVVYNEIEIESYIRKKYKCFMNQQKIMYTYISLIAVCSFQDRCFCSHHLLSIHSGDQKMNKKLKQNQQP